MNRGQFVAVIAAISASAVLPSCIRGEPDPGPLPEASPSYAALPDTLILTAPDGSGIWLTEGRPAVAPSGESCVERTIEIRRDSVRIKVPLLYTATPPVLLNDSTLRAELAENCRSTRSYRVSIRTAYPYPIETR